MFGISFANPVFVSALMLAGVPLAIHMLTLRTPKRLLFPTIRFIKRAEASQSALFRLRHLILLALRTLLVLLIVFTFLRPVLTKGMLAPPGGGASGRATIIVLDASMSMDWRGGSMSPFDRGRQIAQKLAGSLGSDQSANLILAASSPRATFKEPTGNFFLIRQDLEKARAVPERANLDAAFAEAARQFRAIKDPSGALHIITDGQRTNWASLQMPALPKTVEVVFHKVGDSGENAAVSEITIQPPEPAAGEEVTLSCKVSNFAARARTIPVTISLRDEKEWTQSLDLQPNASGTALVRFRALNSGAFMGEAVIPEDGLSHDNRRCFALNVRERVRVLVVSAEDPQSLDLGTAYLMRAIAPAGNDARGGLQPEHITPIKLDKFALAGAQVTMVHGAGSLGNAAIGALQEYLSGGGSVIWFATGADDKDSLARLAARIEKDFTWPVEFGSSILREGAAGPDPAVFSEANFDHPMLRRFRDRADIAEVGFNRYLTTTRNKDRGQILIRYDDGNAAIAKCNAGLGQMLLCNFSPARTASDLARQPVFLPLVHEMIRHMRPEGAGRRAFEPGAPFAATVSLPTDMSEISLLDPQGDRMTAAIEVQAGEAMVFCPRAPEPGLYQIRSGDETLAAIAVNPDSRESDLAPLGETDLAALARVASERIIAGETREAGDAVSRLMEGRPLWHYILLAALVLLAFEQLFALRWMKRGAAA